jgi:hypothetical protein
MAKPDDVTIATILEDCAALLYLAQADADLAYYNGYVRGVLARAADHLRENDSAALANQATALNCEVARVQAQRGGAGRIPLPGSTNRIPLPESADIPARMRADYEREDLDDEVERHRADPDKGAAGLPPPGDATAFGLNRP